MKFTDIHKAILDSMGEGVFVIDWDMTILYANPASVNLTGYTAEESIGRRAITSSANIPFAAGISVLQKRQ